MNTRVHAVLLATLISVGLVRAYDMTPEEEEMNRWMTEEWANELYQSDNPHDLLVGAKIAAYAKTPRTDSRLPAWTSDYSAPFVEDGEFAAWELAKRVVSERAGAGHTD